MYLPSIGLFLVVVWIAAETDRCWPQVRIIIVIGAVSILVALGVLTWRQAAYWHDSETLFAHSAAVNTNNCVALANIGGSLFERGQLAEALPYFKQAVEINPGYADALNSLGAVLAAEGHQDEAMRWFQRALEVEQPGTRKPSSIPVTLWRAATS